MGAKGIGINVETHLADVGTINANENQLRDVLTNLIFNAIDAMPDGGTITIRSTCDHDQATLTVSDTGTGMNDETIQRCFEPFFSTKGGNGAGLGLSMVHGIVRRHKGEIDIKSNQDEGTTITIVLPILQSDAEHAPEPKTDGVIPTAQKILVIDDEESAREVILECLKTDNHSVETAEDGQQGVESFFEGDFDLVITDRAMPRMNGDQVAAAVKGMNANTPVIMLTGFADTTNDQTFNIDIVVNKPVTRDKLRHAISAVILPE